MGFFDRIFNRGKAYSAKQNPSLACELTIDGGKYLLEEFDMDYDGESDKRYVPLYAVFSDKLQPELEAWIANGGKRKEGTVKFFQNVDTLSEGAVFTLTFYDAACVRYRKTTRGDTTTTTLVVAARGIKILNQEI